MTTTSWATEPVSDRVKTRQMIEAQAAEQDSHLNQQIRQLIEQNQLPQNSQLQLAGIDLLQDGPTQQLNDCQERCLSYERKFFRQISDIRWRNNDGTQMKLWVIGIYTHVLRIWESDANGNKGALLREEVAVDNVIFL